MKVESKMFLKEIELVVRRKRANLILKVIFGIKSIKYLKKFFLIFLLVWY